MGFLTDDLLKSDPFSYEQMEKQKGGRLYAALMEELCFHYDNNELYRRFCVNKGFNPYNYNGELSDIPPVHVSVFKELGSQLNSVPREDVKILLQSSATSGIPSSVPVDALTAKRQTRSMVKVVSDYLGNERKPFLVMDVDPMSGFRDILGARYAAVSGYLNFASDVGYFLKVNDNRQYYFDIAGIKDFVNKFQDQSAVLFGFTYILYSEVIKPLVEQGIRIPLPNGSKVIHIGGWKKLESEKISKEQFNRLTAGVFGLAETEIIDIYGFTEQMGINYPDCPCGCKHVPLYSEVIVRDMATKDVLPPGQEGLLEFITPVPHSYPGNVVLTDDVGLVVDGPCDFGRAGRRFKVLGRLKKAEIRGCGDILSSKLKFAKHSSATVDAVNCKSQHSIFYEGQTHFESKAPAETIVDLEIYLRDQLAWMRAQPIDAIIGLIATVAKTWREKTSSIKQNQDMGLNFLVSWCSPNNLLRLANDGLRGNRLHADGFIAVDDSGVRYMRSTSIGLVCHWLAGNVQVLGMFVLIQSILTKNVNLLRTSSRDNGAFVSLLTAFKGVTYTTHGGYEIRGDDLLKTIAVISFEHSDENAGRQMSMIADARVAWGGVEAVGTVTAFPSKYDCEDIIMGPKISFSVISKEAIEDEHRAKKLARKIAVDASVFDQTGCASTHNVFVEKGAVVSPADFAVCLAVGMAKVAKQIPKGDMTADEFAAVHSTRGIYDFKGKVYADDGSIWTVVYDDESNITKPVYSRVVFVHAVDEITDALAFVNSDIQTIGLAANGDKAMNFATRAAEHGALRFPVPGKMLNFESPWDGMFIMERLVRWNTLGGPLV